MEAREVRESKENERERKRSRRKREGECFFFLLDCCASLGRSRRSKGKKRAEFKLTGRGHGVAAEDARHAAHEGGLAAACDEFCKRVERAYTKSEVSIGTGERG